MNNITIKVDTPEGHKTVYRILYALGYEKGSFPMVERAITEYAEYFEDYPYIAVDTKDKTFTGNSKPVNSNMASIYIEYTDLGKYLQYIIDDELNTNKTPIANNPTKILTIDELKVDQYITIHSWNNGDHSWVGEVLKVKAVQLPFIAVIEHQNHNDGGFISLDTRLLTLMELSPEYVEAMKIK